MSDQGSLGHDGLPQDGSTLKQIDTIETISVEDIIITTIEQAGKPDVTLVDRKVSRTSRVLPPSKSFKSPQSIPEGSPIKRSRSPFDGSPLTPTATSESIGEPGSGRRPISDSGQQPSPDSGPRSPLDSTPFIDSRTSRSPLTKTATTDSIPKQGHGQVGQGSPVLTGPRPGRVASSDSLKQGRKPDDDDLEPPIFIKHGPRDGQGSPEMSTAAVQPSSSPGALEEPQGRHQHTPFMDSPRTSSGSPLEKTATTESIPKHGQVTPFVGSSTPMGSHVERIASSESIPKSGHGAMIPTLFSGSGPSNESEHGLPVLVATSGQPQDDDLEPPIFIKHGPKDGQRPPANNGQGLGGEIYPTILFGSGKQLEKTATTESIPRQGQVTPFVGSSMPMGSPVERIASSDSIPQTGTVTPFVDTKRSGSSMPTGSPVEKTATTESIPRHGGHTPFVQSSPMPIGSPVERIASSDSFPQTGTVTPFVDTKRSQGSSMSPVEKTATTESIPKRGEHTPFVDSSRGGHLGHGHVPRIASSESIPGFGNVDTTPIDGSMIPTLVSGSSGPDSESSPGSPKLDITPFVDSKTSSGSPVEKTATTESIPRQRQVTPFVESSRAGHPGHEHVPRIASSESIPGSGIVDTTMIPTLISGYSELGSPEADTTPFVDSRSGSPLGKTATTESISKHGEHTPFVDTRSGSGSPPERIASSESIPESGPVTPFVDSKSGSPVDRTATTESIPKHGQFTPFVDSRSGSPVEKTATTESIPKHGEHTPFVDSSRGGPGHVPRIASSESIPGSGNEDNIPTLYSPVERTSTTESIPESGQVTPFVDSRSGSPVDRTATTESIPKHGKHTPFVDSVKGSPVDRTATTESIPRHGDHTPFVDSSRGGPGHVPRIASSESIPESVNEDNIPTLYSPLERTSTTESIPRHGGTLPMPVDIVPRTLQTLPMPVDTVPRTLRTLPMPNDVEPRRSLKTMPMPVDIVPRRLETMPLPVDTMIPKTLKTLPMPVDTLGTPTKSPTSAKDGKIRKTLPLPLDT